MRYFKRFLSSLDRLLSISKKKSFLFALLFILLTISILLVNKSSSPLGLRGKFYNNDSWSDSPVLQEVSKKMHFQKLEMSKLVGYSEKYSIIWEGFIFIPRNSEYLFSITSDDGSWVFVDDALIIDNGDRHGAVKKENKIYLQKGSHRIKIKYFDAGGLGVVDFNWRGNGSRAKWMPELPLYSSPASESRYRLNRALLYLKILLIISIFIVGFMLLLIIYRSIFVKTDILSFIATCIFLLLLFIYGSKIFLNKSTAVTACDSYAYLQGTVLMSQKGILHTEIEDALIPLIYKSYGAKPDPYDLIFFLSPHGHYVSDLDKGIIYNVFPPGLSWLLLPFMIIGGSFSVFNVLPLLNLIFVVLFFYFSAKYVHIFFGICVSAFAFFNLIVFENTIVIMSDLPSMIFLALSLFLLFLNLKTPKWYLPFLAGACFGFAWAIRYSNLMAIIPVGFVFLIKLIQKKKGKDIILDFVSFSGAAFAVGIIPVAVYTQRLFGTFLRTVYEPITQSKMQGVNFIPGTSFYLNSLAKNFGLIGIAIVLVGLAGCFAHRKRRLVALAGILGFLAFFIFYSFHSIRHERYLMPIYPFLAVFYGFGVLAVGKIFNKVKFLKFLLVAVLATYPLVYSLNKFDTGEFTQEKICQQLKNKVEDNAVVFCDLLTGPVRLYSGLSGFRFIWTKPSVLQETLEILNRNEKPVYFFLDSDFAVEHFQSLLERNVLDQKNFVFISEINGIKLYKRSEKAE